MVSGVRVPDESPFAGVAKLADALDLGSSALRRGGSTPFTCTTICYAGVAQLVECHLAKVDVASSSLVFRSIVMRVSYIGNTPAFQAGKVGSIPTTRSMYPFSLCL